VVGATVPVAPCRAAPVAAVAVVIGFPEAAAAAAAIELVAPVPSAADEGYLVT